MSERTIMLFKFILSNTHSECDDIEYVIKQYCKVATLAEVSLK